MSDFSVFGYPVEREALDFLYPPEQICTDIPNGVEPEQYVFLAKHNPVLSGGVFYAPEEALPLFDDDLDFDISEPEEYEKHDGINYNEDFVSPMGMNEYTVPDTELTAFLDMVRDKTSVLKEGLYKDSAVFRSVTEAYKNVEAALRDGLSIGVDLDYDGVMDAFTHAFRLSSVSTLTQHLDMPEQVKATFLHEVSVKMAERLVDSFAKFDAHRRAMEQVVAIREYSDNVHARVQPTKPLGVKR